jgi:hypothetical protein
MEGVFSDAAVVAHALDVQVRIPMKGPSHSEGSGPGIPEEVAHPFRGKRPGHRSEATLAA